jgi:hypothetical protein
VLFHLEFLGLVLHLWWMLGFGVCLCEFCWFVLVFVGVVVVFLGGANGISNGHVLR